MNRLATGQRVGVGMLLGILVTGHVMLVHEDRALQGAAHDLAAMKDERDRARDEVGGTLSTVRYFQQRAGELRDQLDRIEKPPPPPPPPAWIAECVFVNQSAFVVMPGSTLGVGVNVFGGGIGGVRLCPADPIGGSGR